MGDSANDRLDVFSEEICGGLDDEEFEVGLEEMVDNSLWVPACVRAVKKPRLRLGNGWAKRMEERGYLHEISIRFASAL